MEQSRNFELQHWLCQHFSMKALKLIPLTGDAGFRQYYRFSVNDLSYIAVDAPPDKSNNKAFVNIQKAFNEQNVLVPKIISMNLEKGFFCLSDFGDVLFANTITQKNMQIKYTKAIDLLPKIWQASFDNQPLPVYDQAFILLELNIFKEWLLIEHLQLQLTNIEMQLLSDCFNYLSDNALSQPQVVMHRDYHSRNIMMLNDDNLGVIDFQDAVIGPITYDIVSLLRDCYVRWSNSDVKQLFLYFCQLAKDKYPEIMVDQSEWQCWFDLMGVQRHIKASGIFARLYHRDGKKGYLKDIPLTLGYIVDICALYPELSFLHDLVKNRVFPKIYQLEIRNDKKVN